MAYARCCMSKSKLIYRLLSVLIFLGSLLVSASLLRNIKPFEIQKLLPEDNYVRQAYEKFNLSYNDENKIFILLKKESSFQGEELYDLLYQIGRELKFFYGISSSTTLENAKYFKVEGGGFQLIPFLERSGWSKYALNKLETQFWKKTLISEDHRAVLVTVSLSAKLERAQRVVVAKKIMSLVEGVVGSRSEISTYYLGTEIANYWFTKEMIKNQTVITPLILLVIGLFFYFLFKSWKAVFWSYVVIISGYCLTIITIVLIEDGIGPYSSFALFFVLIISTADLIHFFTKFQQTDSNLKLTIDSIKVPCFLTTLTTLIGFFSLIFNENVPIRYFGLYCSIGAALLYALTFLYLPFCLKSFDVQLNHVDNVVSKRSSAWLWNIVSKYPFAVIAVFGVLTLIFIQQSLTLKIDDNLYRKFLSYHPLSKSVDNFSEGLDFVGSVDVVISSKDKFVRVDNFDFLKKVKLFEDEILKIDTVSYIKSFTQLNDNLLDEVGEDSNIEKKDLVRSLLEMLYDYGALNSMYKKNANELRSVVFLNGLNSVELEKTIQKIGELAKHNKDLVANVSGFAAIRNYINQNVIRSFVNSFAVSFIIIFIIFFILFRSFKWTVVAMIPNVFPLLTVSGLMGIFNVTMESNLIILVSITIGIAVDDTIHFMITLRENLKNDPLVVSIKKSMEDTLKALTGTTIILLLCFPVFFLADLRLFVQIGIFLFLSFIAALLGDIVLLSAIFFKYGKRIMS